MENNESKWTTIKVDSMYRLIDPIGAFVASASKLNCDSIASFLNNYQALKEENEEYKKILSEIQAELKYDLEFEEPINARLFYNKINDLLLKQTP
jgi:cell shape-determining protein MreC